MKYAGFLGDDLSKHLKTKPVPSRPLPPGPPPTKSEPPPENLVLLMSPTGKAPDGSPMPFVSDNV